MTAAFVMSVAQSAYCYASSFGDNKLLALGGNTGNFIHDVCTRRAILIVGPC
jgi:delta14-sterol reductase